MSVKESILNALNLAWTIFWVFGLLVFAIGGCLLLAGASGGFNHP